MASVTKAAGSASNDSGIGSLAWGTPSNAITTGSSFATINDLDEIEVSNYLKTVGYAFAIPTGSTIDGVVFTWNCCSFNNNDYINSWGRLVKNNVIDTGNTRGPQLQRWPNNPEVFTYTLGGPTDTWGGLTVSDVNNANFGFAFWVDGDTNNTYPQVNTVKMTVYYTEPPSGPTNLKTRDTNLKANIKSIDSNLIANVKSVDTIT